MRLLLTNDDGVHAPGLLALREALEEGNTVEVVAPDRQRSGTGHAITVDQPLRVIRTGMAGGELGAYAVNGTPSDCVKVGLEAILPWVPDFVVSGINQGPNLGTDVLYSGTVSAALEGAIHGIPALAVSLVSWERTDVFRWAARVARVILQEAEKRELPGGSLLNVNVPAETSETVPSVRFTGLGVRRYVNACEGRIDPWGRTYYWLTGDVVDEGAEDPYTDIGAVGRGLVSVTPLQFDLTDYQLLEKMRGTNLSLEAAVETEGGGEG